MPVVKLSSRAEVGGVKNNGFEVGIDAATVRFEVNRVVLQKREKKFQDFDKLSWSELRPLAKLEWKAGEGGYDQ